MGEEVKQSFAEELLAQYKVKELEAVAEAARALWENMDTGGLYHIDIEYIRPFVSALDAYWSDDERQ